MGEPRLRVLVVHRSLIAAGAAAIVVRVLGYPARVASDGLTALETARRFRPDAVLIDADLPGMGPIELANRLREQPESAEAVIVLVTAQARPTLDHKVIDVELVQPITADRLRLLLEAVAEMHRRARKIETLPVAAGVPYGWAVELHRRARVMMARARGPAN